jgi:hypothetical protein
MTLLKLTEARIIAGMPERTAELARNIDDGIYDTKDGDRTLTPLEVLERADPSHTYEADPWLRGTDVLQRLFMTYGINTRHDHLSGVRAATVGEMLDAGGGRGAVLFPLWVERGMRAAMVSALDTSRFYQSTMATDGNSALRPHNLATRIAADPLQRSILGLLVGVQEIGDGRPYTSFHMTEDSGKTTMRRSTEFAPPAVYSLTGTDRVKRMKEHAIEIDVSYKALREYALPVLQQHLDWVTQRSMRSKEQVAYEIHRDGDGGSAASTNTNVSSLSGGVANTVTGPNILEFLRLFEGDGDYAPSICIATSAVQSVFDRSTFGSANHPTFGPLGMFGNQGASPEGRSFPPRYARSYCTANRAYFFDAGTLRMMYTPVLVERDRVIDGRFEKIVISEETGFDHIRDGGRRSLDTAN